MPENWRKRIIGWRIFDGQPVYSLKLTDIDRYLCESFHCKLYLISPLSTLLLIMRESYVKWEKQVISFQQNLIEAMFHSSNSFSYWNKVSFEHLIGAKSLLNKLSLVQNLSQTVSLEQNLIRTMSHQSKILLLWDFQQVSFKQNFAPMRCCSNETLLTLGLSVWDNYSSMFLSICAIPTNLHTIQLTYLSTNLPTHLHTYKTDYLPKHLLTKQPNNLPTYIPTILLMHLHTYQPIFLPTCLPTYLLANIIT